MKSFRKFANPFQKLAVMLTIVAMFVSCRSVNTTDNSNDNDSGLHVVTTVEEVSYDEIMNDPRLSEMLKQAIIAKLDSTDSDTTITIEVSPSEVALNDLFIVSPNPTSSDAVISLNPIYGTRGDKTLELDLYYMDKKIETLTLSATSDNKFVITSNYLQKEGTYTIVMPGSKISASFVVKK